MHVRLALAQTSGPAYAGTVRSLTTKRALYGNAKRQEAYERLLAYHKASDVSQQGQNTEDGVSSKQEQASDAVEQARREWRWIKEEVQERQKRRVLSTESQSTTAMLSEMVDRLVIQHEPLAYVLGTLLRMQSAVDERIDD